jgi:uncharacterized protein YjbI with pentapeptide repeats
MEEANFAGARIESSKFESANLQKASFKGSTVKESTFKFAKLNDADLSRADFNYTDFENAELKNSNLNRTIFVGVKLEEEQIISSCNWDKAIFDIDAYKNKNFINTLKRKYNVNPTKSTKCVSWDTK